MGKYFKLIELDRFSGQFQLAELTSPAAKKLEKTTFSKIEEFCVRLFKGITNLTTKIVLRVSSRQRLERLTAAGFQTQEMLELVKEEVAARVERQRVRKANFLKEYDYRNLRLKLASAKCKSSRDDELREQKLNAYREMYADYYRDFKHEEWKERASDKSRMTFIYEDGDTDTSYYETYEASKTAAQLPRNLNEVQQVGEIKAVYLGWASYGGGSLDIWVIEGYSAQLTTHSFDSPYGYIQGKCLEIPQDGHGIIFQPNPSGNGWPSSTDEKDCKPRFIRLEDIARYDFNHMHVY